MQRQDDEQCLFDLGELRPYVDLSSFRFMLVALSATKVAIATYRYLIIMEEDNILSGNDEGDEERDKIQTVVEFGEVSGCPTSIEWINGSILCVGFETGALTCFNDFGETISEHEFSSCPLVAIHVLPSPDPAIKGQNIWALYENGFLISVPVSHLLGGSSLARYYIRFKLVDVTTVNDFAVLPQSFTGSLFDIEAPAPTSTFLVSGVKPSLSLYTIGGKQHFQHLGKLASYVKDRVGSALSKTVGSALVSFFGSGAATGASSSHDVSDDDEYTPLSSFLDFEESDKRVILRLSVSPGGKLIAAADTLGRVLLFDARLPSTVVRIWKGVREARFAWSEDKQLVPNTSSTPPKYKRLLTLAIYAPQMGLLSLWALRHGPCLRSIPVGAQCHIFSAIEIGSDGLSQSRCALLRVQDGINKIHFSLVSPLDHSDDDIDLAAMESDSEGQFPEMSNAEHLSADPDMLISSFESMDNLDDATSGVKSVSILENEHHLLQQQQQQESLKIVHAVERVVNALIKKSVGVSGVSGVDMSSAESNMWMRISSLRDVSALLICICVIDKCENEVYLTSFKKNIGMPLHDAHSYHPCFSLQFHRNLCRLMVDLSTSTNQSTEPHNYIRYAQWRQNLVKAYENLFECNSQVSLAYTPPPGTEHNKWSATNIARAEAICWAARRMAPTSQLIRQSMVASSSTVSSGLSGANVTKSSRQADKRGWKNVQFAQHNTYSSYASTGGVIDTRRESSPPRPKLTVQTSHDGSKGPVGVSSPLRTTHQSYTSSKLATPHIPSGVVPSTTQVSTAHSTPDTDSQSSHSYPPVAMFIAFHQENFLGAHSTASILEHPSLSTGGGGGSGISNVCAEVVALKGGGRFQYTAMVDLLDALDGTSNSSHLEETPLTSSLTSHVPPAAALSVLNFIFLPLLGDAFALKRFDLAVNAMGLGGGGGLRHALPLLLRFLEHQPIAVIFNSLVNRQMSSSPLQRWLRDTLLEFQSFVGSTAESADDEPSDNPASSNTSSRPINDSDTNEPFTLSQLLQGVLSDRNTPGCTDITGDYQHSGHVGGVNGGVSGVGDESVDVVDVCGEEIISATSEIIPPSLDEIVRYILRPAWLQARKSLQLESTMIIVAQILEVLEAVNDQIERSSFGDVTLEGAKAVWTTLIRQLRVAMLLSSRASGVLSVDRLGSGQISIYALLAADTLCFAQQADQAAEHELRCQEVYAKRAARTPSDERTASVSVTTSTSSTDQEIGALLAWGPTADARWKELVTVAEAEDAFVLEALGVSLPQSSPKTTRAKSSSSSSRSKSASANKKIRRRRPLLLFFPGHNQPCPLGAYRAFALVDRWARRPRKIEVLSLAGAHLLAVPPVTRAAVAERILLYTVFPLLRSFLDLEEGKLSKGSESDTAQDLVAVIADAELVELFVQATVELISFALNGSGGIHSRTSSQNAIASTASGALVMSSHTTATATENRSHSKQQSQTNPTGREIANTSSDPIQSNFFYKDEAAPDVWPPVNDARLHHLVVESQQYGGVCDISAQWNMCLVWILQLRTQCGLRGVKVSELMGSELLLTMCGENSLSEEWGEMYTSTYAGVDSQIHNKDGDGDSTGAAILRGVREEFMLQCFRRLEAQSSNIVYSVAEVWGISNKQARLTHLSVLLELGNDDVIGELMNHFDNSSEVCDRITYGIRCRVGASLFVMERIPACGSLLASLDPTAYQWARECIASTGQPVSNTGSSDSKLTSHSMSGNISGLSIPTTPTGGQSSDIRTVIEGVMKGKLKVVNFDVSSSRHLVVRVQALLFCVPLGNRDSRWMDRKTKCDWLLSLCGSLSDSEVKAHLKGTGLKYD